MVSTHLIMPVRDQLDYTKAICTQLLTESGWDWCWVFDNGSAQDTQDYLRWLGSQDCFVTERAEGWQLYEMWEAGLDRARESSGDRFNAVLINNDITLAPDTLTLMARALRSDDDLWLVYPNYDRTLESGVEDLGLRYTSGTYRHGGMSGFCFMVKGERINWAPLVDPRLVWWGGDDDIAFTIEERGGKQARLEGLPIFHVNEGTARHHDLAFQKAEDLARVGRKWKR